MSGGSNICVCYDADGSVYRKRMVNGCWTQDQSDIAWAQQERERIYRKRMGIEDPEEKERQKEESRRRHYQDANDGIPTDKEAIAAIRKEKKLKGLRAELEGKENRKIRFADEQELVCVDGVLYKVKNRDVYDYDYLTDQAGNPVGVLSANGSSILKGEDARKEKRKQNARKLMLEVVKATTISELEDLVAWTNNYYHNYYNSKLPDGGGLLWIRGISGGMTYVKSYIIKRLTH
jgi:hypothetical protein